MATTSNCYYLDTNVKPGVSYSYQVLSQSSATGALSPPSAPPVGVTAGAVNAPANIYANVNGAQIELRWSISPGATSYHIYRWKSSDPEPTQPYAIISSACGMWTDWPPLDGNNYDQYSYCVAAVSGGVESAQTGPATATPDSNPKLGCQSQCSGDVTQNVNEYVSPYCVGTNCGVQGSTGVIDQSNYYLQSTALSINGAVVSSWNNNAGDTSVKQTVRSALFDSTNFSDGTVLDICMTSTANGIVEYPGYQVPPPPVTKVYHIYSTTFNRAAVYGNSVPSFQWEWGLGSIGSNIESDAVTALGSMNYNTGISSTGADKVDILSNLPGASAFVMATHGNAGNFSSCLGTNAASDLDILQTKLGPGMGGNADDTLEPTITQETALGNTAFPGTMGYRFAFLVACSTTFYTNTTGNESGTDTQLSDAFGITSGVNDQLDRAYVGFPVEILIDSSMQDCASSVLQLMQRGHTVQDALIQCSPADEYVPDPNAPAQTVYPDFLGDPNMTLHSCVYGSSSYWGAFGIDGNWWIDTSH